MGELNMRNNAEQNFRLLFLIVPFAVLFLNIIWLSFDWLGMIKVWSFQKGNFLNIIQVYLEYS